MYVRRMNARDFHDEIVAPTLWEFDDEFGDPRRAFLAVAVLDALVGHIYAEAKHNGIDPFAWLGGRYVKGGKDISITDFDETNDQNVVFQTELPENNQNDSYFRERLADDCSAFRIIRDLAKANKHAELTRGSPLVSSSDQAASKPMGFGQGRFGVGRYGGVPQMMIRLNSLDPVAGEQETEEVYLEHALREAYETASWALSMLDRDLERERRGYDWHVATEPVD